MLEFPKIIHFIWFDFKNELNKNPIIPNKYLETIENTKKINQDYKIKIWNGFDCDQLIKKFFPDKYQIYNNFKYPIQRCDYIRFVILYIYGGIYSDMDRICVKSYNNIIDNYADQDVILGSITSFKILNNDIIISKPMDNFILKCIKNVKMYNIYFEFIYVMMVVGPLYLEKIYLTYYGKSKIKILHDELNPCNHCTCDIHKMDKVISYTTLDNTWIKPSYSKIIFSFITCKFMYILIVIIFFLIYKLYKK